MAGNLSEYNYYSEGQSLQKHQFVQETQQVMSKSGTGGSSSDQWNTKNLHLEDQYHIIYPLVNEHLAMEKWPFIVDLSIKNGDCP